MTPVSSITRCRSRRAAVRRPCSVPTTDANGLAAVRLDGTGAVVVFANANNRQQWFTLRQERKFSCSDFGRSVPAAITFTDGDCSRK